MKCYQYRLLLIAVAGILGANLLAKSSSLTVEHHGDHLQVRAPQMRFIEGEALEKLHNGSTVAFVFSMVVVTEQNAKSTFQLEERFLVSYDLWEENPQYLHPYTLGALSTGLQAAAELSPAHARSWGRLAAQINSFVLTHGIQNGHLIKSTAVPSESSAEGPSLTGVDASLIGISTPYRILSPDDRVMRATVARIETDLHYPGGGVYRYQDDTYYGGGEWVLLAAWLGWYYTEIGQQEQAGAILRWIEAQADRQGALPEQVSTHLLSPSHYPAWEARWGTVARPLLWSHAMYVILYHALAC